MAQSHDTSSWLMSLKMFESLLRLSRCSLHCESATSPINDAQDATRAATTSTPNRFPVIVNIGNRCYHGPEDDRMVVNDRERL